MTLHYIAFEGSKVQLIYLNSPTIHPLSLLPHRKRYSAFGPNRQTNNIYSFPADIIIKADSQCIRKTLLFGLKLGLLNN